jgi:anti-sigma factor RsiW
VNCDEFVELVTEFLEGALDEGSQARFVEHLATCDGCETYLDQVRTTVGSLAGLPAVEALPAEARERLLAAFRESR